MGLLAACLRNSTYVVRLMRRMVRMRVDVDARVALSSVLKTY